MTPEQLEDLLDNNRAPLILDVRSGLEFNSGHIPGALHAPLPGVLNALENAVKDKHSPVVIVCEHGPRAQVAKLFLKLKGYKNLQLLDGHMARWRSSGRSIQVG